jgi:hypothetical protein
VRREMEGRKAKEDEGRICRRRQEKEKRNEKKMVKTKVWLI